MDRKKYLYMCCECSKLPKGAMGIPTQIPEELIIKFNDIEYYPYQYVLSYDNGKTRHSAVLHDVNANSVVQTNLLNL